MKQPDDEDLDQPYLWDRSGPVDPEVARLEKLLAPLRHRAPLASEATHAQPNAEAVAANVSSLAARRRPRTGAVVAVAAMLALAAAILLWLRNDAEPLAARALPMGDQLRSELAELPRPPSPTGLEFEALAGAPTWGADSSAAKGVLPTGAWMETDASTRVKLTVADIGHVEIDPSSRVRVMETGASAHRIELGRGKLRAEIDAPPRLFFVDTPAATAVDLGCAYELEVDERGAGMLRVTSGFVELEPVQRDKGRIPSLVPKGAECSIDPVTGPGTPVWTRSPPALRAALRRFDAMGALDALDEVLAGLGPRDTLTLFHLVHRVPDERRGAVLDRLEGIERRPTAAPRKSTLELEPEAIQAWRNELEPRWFPKPTP